MEIKNANMTAEISAYLESKYGENFVVDRLVSDDGTPGVPNKAYVHPEGRKADWFAVRFTTDKDSGLHNFKDGYGFVFAQKALLAEYEAWLLNVIPEARIVLDVDSGSEVTRVDHQPDTTFDEFAGKEKPFGIEANIFINEKELENKESLFETLSTALYDVPLKELFVECYIVFIKAAEFASLDVAFYRGGGSVGLLDYEKISVSSTSVIISDDITEADILKRLNIFFKDGGEADD